MDLKQEIKLWKQGYQMVAGLDEAGRGSLSGPVVAAAVVLRNPKPKCQMSNQTPARLAADAAASKRARQSPNVKIKYLLKQVNDSKKLSAKKREQLYKILINHPFIEWGIGRTGNKVIDKINILQATKLAMNRAVKNLEDKLREKGVSDLIDFLILDGKMALNLEIPQKSIIGADGKVFSCAAASILAKVIRDKAMVRYHKTHPLYGFKQHKGYGTEYHRKMLTKYGACKIHRKTFKPVLYLKA